MRPSHVLAAAVPLLLAAGILGYALVGSDGPPGPEASGL
jgi:hypothetical protein